MIAARFSDGKGGIAIMLVLEPGNLEKLKRGEYIHKFINEFIPELPTKIELLVAYTPDAVWVTEQMKDSGGSTVKLAELIHESLSREPVLVRGKTAEEMKKVV
jgi:hypothetical protein